MRRIESWKPILVLWGILWTVPLPADDSPVVAHFTTTVTQEELDGWRRHLNRPDTSNRDLDLRELILVKSLAAEAVRLGLAHRPEVRLQLEFKEAGLVEKALRRDLVASIEISDEAVEAKYQEYKDTFALPRRVRLRNLFKRYPPDADEAARAAVRREVEELRQRVLDGEDFAQLASEHSNSQTRFRGGLIGNVSPGTLAPEVDAVTMAMEAGDLSEILSGPDGLTLLYCEKVLEKVVRSAEELRQIARQRLGNQEFKRRWGQSQARWIDAAEAQYHWQALEEDAAEDAVVVELAGDEFLNRSHVWALVRPQDPLEIPRPQLERRIENYLLVRGMLREVDRRHLAETEALAENRLWARRRVLAEWALLHKVEERFQEPSDEEVRQYFDDHRETFVRPLHFDLAVILLPPLGQDPREGMRQGEQLVHQLETGALTFEDAARQHSRHPSAAEGGRLKPLSQLAMGQIFGFQIRRAIQQMAVGEISGLVQEENKLWIFKLLAREEERPKTWAEAKTEAENLLGGDRAKAVEAEVRSEWMTSLAFEATPPVPRQAEEGQASSADEN